MSKDERPEARVEALDETAPAEGEPQAPPLGEENGAAEAGAEDARASQAEASAEAAAEDQIPAEDLLAQLQTELQAALEKAEENLDGWQRSLADFSNYKKRVERDQATVYQQATGKVVLKYLDIADDLERALQNRPQEGDGAAWADGIELIYRKLQGLLQAEGVERLDTTGEAFDPNLHEAISQEESDEFESGQIIAVVKNGYKIGDRVIRPAVVRVAR